VGRRLLAALLALGALCGCRDAGKAPRVERPLRIFHAANITAYFDAVREPVRRELGLRLANEPSGAQVVCRKVAELGRECDLLVLSDPRLVGELLHGHASWRLDFAADEMVLVIGARAPAADEAESDWPAVMLRPEVRIGRVDEQLAPAGYLTLMVWQLQERLAGPPGLRDRLVAKTAKVVEDVSQLAALLKQGELDYAFSYRSLCLAWDLRHVALAPEINLGDPDRDYSAVEERIRPVGGTGREVRIRGAPILYTLTIPQRGADVAAATEFIRFMLSDRQRENWQSIGYQLLPRARFYGSRQDYAPFADLAEYAGDQP